MMRRYDRAPFAGKSDLLAALRELMDNTLAAQDDATDRLIEDYVAHQAREGQS